MSKIINSIFHVVFLLIAFSSLNFIELIPKRYLPILELLPFFLYILSLILGYRFNRSLVIYSSSIFISCYLYFWFLPHWSTTQHFLALNSLAIIAAVNIALISYYSERGVFTYIGIIRLSLIALFLLIPYWLVNDLSKNYLQMINQVIFPALEVKLVFFKQSALLAILLSMIIISSSFMARSNPFRSAILVSLILCLYALTLPKNHLLSQAVITSFAILLPLISLISESYRMAFIDELTNLPGRRALNETLAKLSNQYVIAMLDVDHFKKFNDTYGHDAGDDVLQLLGGRLKNVTGGGQPFRYGGEEFTIVFPGSGLDDVEEHLEQLRESVANRKFSLRKQERRKKGKSKKSATGRQVNVTISIGYAEPSSRNKTPTQVIKEADKALYKAKKKGRNCISH
ncbi:MAG: GGDEF domain-containing protein [Gammaproteobacteria bacterium]|nr:GGDEF domain-containing protein [Gammaproteobacteria bacterium]